MALPSGVSTRAVCKPPLSSSTSSPNSPAGARLVRRRGRGALVRSKACVWSKHELDRLHALSLRPRHHLVPDIIDVVVSAPPPMTTTTVKPSVSIASPLCADDVDANLSMDATSIRDHMEAMPIRKPTKRSLMHALPSVPREHTGDDTLAESHEHDVHLLNSELRNDTSAIHSHLCVVDGNDTNAAHLRTHYVHNANSSSTLQDSNGCYADDYDNSPVDSSCRREVAAASAAATSAVAAAAAAAAQFSTRSSDGRVALPRANVPTVTRITTSLVDLSIQ